MAHFISANQAAAVANAAVNQNIGYDGNGDEIETKHQPGSMIPPQHGHASQGGHSQLPHFLQTNQQVRHMGKSVQSTIWICLCVGYLYLG